GQQGAAGVEGEVQHQAAGIGRRGQRPGVSGVARVPQPQPGAGGGGQDVTVGAESRHVGGHLPDDLGSGGGGEVPADQFRLAVALVRGDQRATGSERQDRKSTRLNSSHVKISYAVFCLKKKKKKYKMT